VGAVFPSLPVPGAVPGSLSKGSRDSNNFYYFCIFYIFYDLNDFNDLYSLCYCNTILPHILASVKRVVSQLQEFFLVSSISGVVGNTKARGKPYR